MRTPYTFITSPDSITVYINGDSFNASKTHPNYDKIVKKVKKGSKSEEYDIKLSELFDTAAAVRAYVGEDITISDSGVLTHKGNVIDNVLTQKILAMQSDGFDIEPMLKFLVNLAENPSYAAQQELMLFMEANDMPITPDGHLLAYKSVKSDYKDGYTGKIDNSVGAICEMPRLSVDDDRHRTCSNGLHFAAKNYAGTFISSGHLMVLKIHPRDVVAIPSDYNNEKGRCCRYEVIDEVPMSAADKDKFNTTSVYEEDTEEDGEYYDGEYYCHDCGVYSYDSECIECGDDIS